MLMKPCPFSNEALCPGRANFPVKQFPGEIERSQLALVLNVEMGWIVIIEKHSNDEAEER